MTLSIFDFLTSRDERTISPACNKATPQSVPLNLNQVIIILKKPFKQHIFISFNRVLMITRLLRSKMHLLKLN